MASDAERNPFEILGVLPSAERVVVTAAYRALAKKYHPDVNRSVPPDELTRIVTELNWAWEQLEQDLDGWRRRVGHVQSTGTSEAKRSRPAPDAPDRQDTGPKSFRLKPGARLVCRRGGLTRFQVLGEGLKPTDIHARFMPEKIRVVRLRTNGPWATFDVSARFEPPEYSKRYAEIELSAPGFIPVTVDVFVARPEARPI